MDSLVVWGQRIGQQPVVSLLTARGRFSPSFPFLARLLIGTCHYLITETVKMDFYWADPPAGSASEEKNVFLGAIKLCE